MLLILDENRHIIGSYWFYIVFQASNEDPDPSNVLILVSGNEESPVSMQGNQIANELENKNMRVIYNLWKRTEIRNMGTAEWVTRKLMWADHVIFICTEGDMTFE